MKPKILITDTLFITKADEQKMLDAGFEIERIEDPGMDNVLLREALKDKTGYIIGGTESVTDEVIESADNLKVITFTGADWAHFIPGHELATKKGIRITNTPGTTMFAVAEFTLTLLLMMLRRALELGGPGDAGFITTKSLANSHIGIIGVGYIGTEMVRMLTALGAKVSYWDRNRNTSIETQYNATYLTLDELFSQCDIISNHVSSQAGEIITGELINKTKEDVLFVNTGAGNTFNMDALYDRIASKKARAAFDVHGIKDVRFDELPLSDWYATNDNGGFNTRQMLDKTNEMAVSSIINALKTGTDEHVVNL
ncbi:MAG: D-isomer specific 2-hydroxyacid dehydrogenase family protein [Candidatus Saccharibacteria bacterium]|nr:D-isomer specific 2-hydroxyacid dehydrogenase family protein [Candidatus Saccharibacteria bacterium]